MAYNIYIFECPNCGAAGDAGIPKSMRTLIRARLRSTVRATSGEWQVWQQAQVGSSQQFKWRKLRMDPKGKYTIRVEISVYADTEDMDDVMRVTRRADVRSLEDAAALGVALDDATKNILGAKK